jgi:hypothetical protein
LKAAPPRGAGMQTTRRPQRFMPVPPQPLQHNAPII